MIRFLLRYLPKFKYTTYYYDPIVEKKVYRECLCVQGAYCQKK